MTNYIVYTNNNEYEFTSLQMASRTLKRFNYTGEAYIYDTKNNRTEVRYCASGNVIVKTPKFTGRHTPSTRTINVMRYL